MKTSTPSNTAVSQLGDSDARICAKMAEELHRQLGQHYVTIEGAFKNYLDRREILWKYAGRFFNYIHRGEILIQEGEVLQVEDWKKLSDDFKHENFQGSYDPTKIVQSILTFLHARGYQLALP